MRRFIRIFSLFALTASLFALTACGNHEAAQRKEFIDFLQTRILNKKGTHVPQLTQNQKDAFGPYAKDYAIITDFNYPQSGKNAFESFASIAARGSFRSIGDLVSRRDDLVKTSDGVNQLQKDLADSLTKANTAKAALKQPDDLKAVYDQAYDRDVTQVAAMMQQLFPPLKASVDAMLTLSDFLTANKDKLQISGMTVNATDQATLTALQPLLNNVNTASQNLMKAVQPLRDNMSATNSNQ